MNNLERFWQVRDSLPTHGDKMDFTSAFLGVLSVMVPESQWKDAMKRTLFHRGMVSPKADNSAQLALLSEERS